MRLDIADLEVGYGKLQVLRGISLSVSTGEAVAVVGSNGAGKSTLLRTVAGIMKPWAGTISLDGEPVEGKKPHRLVEMGLALVPEGRHLFAEMSVRENLEVAERVGSRRGSQWRVDEVLDLFPSLRMRLTTFAGRLSGGEQQMVAVGRVLMLGTEIILLDEPSIGLAPRVLAEIMNAVSSLVTESRAGLLIVEQNLRELQRLTGQMHVLDRGLFTESGSISEVTSRESFRSSFLGIRPSSS